MKKLLISIKILIYLFIIVMSVMSMYSTNIKAQWTNLYNGAGDAEDRANYITVDSKKNTYVTGSSKGIGSNYDYLTIKYDSNGVLKWSQRYNGPGNDMDHPTDIEFDTSGNVYVTGYSLGIGTDYDYATIKYNSNGVMQWTQRFNGPDSLYDKATELSIDNTGNIIVTGYTGISFQYDYMTIKYNSSGVEQWSKSYNGTGNYVDYANYAVTDASGNVYVTGTSYGLDSEYDFLTIKYNSSGTLLWSQRGNGTGNTYDEAKKVLVDNSGNVYVTGDSFGTGTGSDYLTAKYNSAGVIQWSHRYDESYNWDYANDLEVDASGNVYITGSGYGNSNSSNITTIKYNNAGSVQWIRVYNGIASANDEGKDLVVDNSGNVYVTGLSATGPIAVIGLDMITLKYDAAGNSRGIIIYAGSGESQDNGNAIAIDNSGNIYAAGFINAANEDFITSKYLSADFLPVNLQLTAFIQGSYNSGSNTQTGDTIKVKLRFRFPPYNIIDSTTAFLSGSGSASMNFYIAPDMSYYISVEHRNSITTWSSDTIPLSNSGVNLYDFSDDVTKAYGSNMIQADASPVRFAIYSGDVNQDGTIDLTDGSLIDNDAFNFASGYLPTDVNGDGIIDVADAVFADNNAFNFVSKITP
ncbi:MAG: SBBP repeat-containing protein [Ignavibacteria bacterium]|nr:SBBP repeat-containing protein [Ignavibacteria bacterium]